MEFHHKKSLFNLIDHEEKNTMSLQSPSRLSIKTDYEMYEHDLQFRPAVSLPCSPGQNPTSTLKLMPAPQAQNHHGHSLLRTPSPSLLYHCIASLYHSEGTVYSIAVSKGLIFTGSGAAAFVRGGNQAAWNVHA
ncbi:hypothetical protein FNV43_RR11593 [Rhamnella rubrinervis]|uniref:Uncharacterized protein n=1 Tax=Rhamnella rubrinervis TaxID=2594499 RepID=A0A8K0H6F5_9ROSA|nr:hypothetical protein FNV43_RR11593 [Rhamnella rubrinervis]